MNQKISPLLQTDPASIGEWKLSGRLGQGGYGTIFLASKEKTQVALKMISKEWLNDIDAEGQLRFANEARILKELDHPNIARIIDQNLKTNIPYIAIEYLEGQTLESKIQEYGPLTESEWFKLSKSLLSALEYCHSKNIIHKDVSPANIIITDNGPKIIDFGNSFLKGSARLTQEGVVNGTPGYMSPEHYEGNDLSAEMDLFSLASVLIFAGTGKPAFTGQSKQEYRNKTLYEAPDLSNLKTNQRELLTPLMYKDPKERPSFEQINKALEELTSEIEFTAYKSVLNHFNKKLISAPKNNLPKRKIRQLVSAVIIALFVTIATIIFISQQSAEASDCTKLYKNGNYEEAITACAFEVSKGNQKFQITLGKAYKRADQTDQAQEVFAKCKNQYFECLHENAFFLKDVNQARKDWTTAYNNGVTNSSWALAISYNKSGDKATANLWIDKAVAVNNSIGQLMKSAQLFDDKDYKASLEIAKSLIGVDLSDYPSNGPIGFTIEKYILDIYEKTKNEVGRREFLEQCAKSNDYCIGELSSYYLGEDNVKAKAWAKKGVAVNNAESMWVLGRLAELSYIDTPEEKSADTTQARYWYKRAAEVGDVAGMFRTMRFAELDKNLEEACLWSNRLIARVDLRRSTWDQRLGDESWKESASGIIQKFKCGLTAEQPTPTPAASKKSSVPSVQPNATKQDQVQSALISSDELSVSSPLDPNVKISNIFGRIFSDSESMWRVILTNSSADPVPPINGIQFRLVGYEDAGWINVPYKLKKDPQFNSVYAAVDELFLVGLFKKFVCPEFRAVRQENGKIVNIWTKVKPECSNDYVP